MINLDEYELPFDGYILDEYAQKAWDAIQSGNKCIYISGGAGCGKSSFLKFLRLNMDEAFVVTAPTGVASINVDGVTVHSFFWLAPHIMKDSDIKTFRVNDEVIKKLETLIIDEISMCSPAMMDTINRSLQIWRRNTKPFGGVRVIMFGDLYQLPVVVRNNEVHYYEEHFPNGPFFFNADVFTRLAITTIEFRNSYRQKDGEFLKLLNNIRLGVDVRKTIDRINELCVKSDAINAPVLTATNARRDKINETMYDKIKMPEMEYIATCTGKLTKDDRFPSPEYLVLKVGARIMVTKNDTSIGVVNGDLGMVCELHADSVVVSLDKGSIVQLERVEWQTFKHKYNKETKHMDIEADSVFKQIPLVLAFAFSIHKAQGISLDKAVIELGTGAFANGQTYVALSRLRTIEGLVLKRPLTSKDIMVDERITEFYRKSLSSEQPMKFNVEEKSASIKEFTGEKVRINKPIIMEEDVPVWCDHIKWIGGQWMFSGMKILDDVESCMFCKAKRVV